VDNDGILQPNEDYRGIVAHCFLLLPLKQDGVFIPVYSFDRLNYSNTSLNLNTLDINAFNCSDGSPCGSYFGGITGPEGYECRYLIDPSLGARTKLIVLEAPSVTSIPATFYLGKIRSTAHHLDWSGWPDIRFEKKNTYLNIFDLQRDAVGLPLSYIEGGFNISTWDPACASPCFSRPWLLCAFLMIESDVIGAVQTILPIEE